MLRMIDNIGRIQSAETPFLPAIWQNQLVCLLPAMQKHVNTKSGPRTVDVFVFQCMGCLKIANAEI